MHAMCIDESEAGVRFNCEREALLQRWQRLTSFLNVYESHGWGLPPNSLADFDKYFNHLIHPLPVAYPKPRPLGPAELRQYDDRAGAIDVGLRTSEPGTPQEKKLLWVEEYASLDQWAKEAFDRANPGLKRRRSSRSTVKQYLKEVQDFCLRWHLDAWWAGPAIYQNHFFRLSIGIEEPLEIYPLGIFQQGAFISDTYPIVAKLPGTIDSDFERDSIRFRNLWLENTIAADAGDIRFRRRPDRPDMAMLELRNNASCVVIDWDGRNHYTSQHDSKKSISVTDHILDECEARAGKTFSKVEKRNVVNQLQSQLTDARKWFLEHQWQSQSRADLELHAKWVASRLLQPQLPWDALDPDAKEDYDSEPRDRAIRRACTEFASTASLNLPIRQRGRPPLGS
jgi:hypothetical protein